MRYKNYTWPHNPRTYEISYRRGMAVHKVPLGRYYMREMGMEHRVLRGEGEFAGPGAYEEFKKLASVFYEGTPGVLVHPVWQSSVAFFVGLSLTMEPSADYVAYSFEFWERCPGYDGEIKAVNDFGSPQTDGGSGGAQGERRTCIVGKGDTMWSIAARNGISLSRLIALNPQIANPNIIYVGDTVYLS
ncbi:MAG: LysM peptidoglycan-binding domain-containing protein [Oscillospiraceae bacterium]|nr:LysM peptidoglycan-binding domain-containing protein [Oscillospiraceae bacterium]